MVYNMDTIKTPKMGHGLRIEANSNYLRSKNYFVTFLCHQIEQKCSFFIRTLLPSPYQLSISFNRKEKKNQMVETVFCVLAKLQKTWPLVLFGSRFLGASKKFGSQMVRFESHRVIFVSQKSIGTKFNKIEPKCFCRYGYW